MRAIFPACITIGLLACGESEELVVSEMERALTTTNHAIAAELLSVELLSHTFEEPDNQLRHGTSCGCPCLDRTGAPPDPYVLILEYSGTACLPQSGLLPAVISGTAIVDWDGSRSTVSLDGMELNLEHEAAGTSSATLTEAGDTLNIEAESSLQLGSYGVVGQTSTTSSPGELTLSGTVAIDGTEVVLDSIVLPTQNVGGACPDPTSGTATLKADTDVVIDFAEPGGGFVQLTRGSRVSESVEYCAYASDLL